MPTLLNDNTLQQSPPQSTLTELTEGVVERITQITKDIFDELIKVQRQGIDLVWNHPVLTPQQVVDGLGSDALKVFQFHGGLTEYIKSVANIDGVTVDLKYPSNAFTVDSSGNITISSDPYIQS
jgi:hypothetical protein